MKRSYVSFDVFDTCLIRRCGNPEIIWDIMTKRLFAEDDLRGQLSFLGNRKIAERKASEKKKNPSLRDIYDEMLVAQYSLDAEGVMDLEMKVEEEELQPNFDVLKMVKKYQEEGFVVVFVSDMYLPSVFIRKILMKFGFCSDDTPVFVSAECKAEKYTGSLFDYVLNQTKTKGNQWIHYGDNRVSDFVVPRLKGYDSKLLSKTEFSKEEKQWLDDAKYYRYKHEIELWSGLSRCFRIQNVHSYAEELAVNFIASIYVPYVVYVLRTAKKEGFERLYFLSRDASVFLSIAENLKYENENVECRYLKINRKILYSSCFYDLSDKEFTLTLGNLKDRTVVQCLCYLGVKWEDLSVETRSKYPKNTPLNSNGKISSFANDLKKNDFNLIKESSEKNRNILFKYLSQKSFFEKKTAIVDLGWVGSGRCVLNYLLTKEDKASVATFLWGYNTSLMYGGKDDDLFVFNRQFDPNDIASCADIFLEEYASINEEKTVFGYRQENENVVAVSERNSPYFESLARINRSVVSSFSREIDSRKISTDAFYDIFLCCGLKQLTRKLVKPNKKLIDFFSRLQVEEGGVESRIIRSLTIKDYVALFLWGKPVSNLWLSASLYRTMGRLTSILREVYGYTSKTIIASKIIAWWERKKTTSAIR